MNYKIPLAFIYLFFVTVCHAQVIPAANRVNWVGAGHEGCLPDPTNIINFNGSDDGTADNSAFLQTEINALGGNAGVIFFNPGVYLFTNTLSLPSNVILRGAGANQTTLRFNLGGQTDKHCLSIATTTQNAPFTNISGGATKSSTSLTVADASTFNVNDYAEIRQTNGSWDTFSNDAWADFAVGQIVKITAKSGNTLTFAPALRLTYTASLSPQIRRINYRENIGIESLKLERTDTPPSGGGSNIFYDFAVNCWVKNVESTLSVGPHIEANRTARLEVTGCYLYQGNNNRYDGTAGRGYGILLNQHSGDCLVENNIFRQLRHAMMVQAGANGNVFAYNYSREPFRNGAGESPSDASYDIVCHGYYPFANLFEGNLVQNAGIDNENGANGPDNTFFRNWVQLYGLGFTPSAVSNSPGQNFVGNDATYFLGNFNLGANPPNFQYANNLRNTIIPAGTTTLPDTSYYHTYKSEIFGAMAWHTFGRPNDLGSGDIPARNRYINSTIKTVFINFPAPAFTVGNPNTPVNGSTVIRSNNTAAAYTWDPLSGNTQSLTVNQSGTYTLSIANDNGCTRTGSVSVIQSQLPVNLLYFEAEVQANKNVQLSWATASEQDSRFFVVERSTNLQNFTAIAQKDAAGRSEQIRHYTYTDTQALQGQSYYRLKQIDTDGSEHIYRPISVEINSKNQIEVYPNPTDNEGVSIEGEGIEEVFLQDLRGRNILIQHIPKNRNQQEIRWLHKLPAGIYLLRIYTANEQIIKKLVVR